MFPNKFTTIVLSIILASSFGSVALSQESKTNFNKDTSSDIGKNPTNVKTPQDTTSPQWCIRYPYC